MSPIAAVAAEQTVRSFEIDFGTKPFVISAIVVQFLWAMGYCASSLPKWAKWKDGNTQDRLGIVSGLFGAACAGNIMFYGLLYGDLVEIKQVHGFIASIIGGFAGERILTMITDRYAAKVGLKETA